MAWLTRVPVIGNILKGTQYDPSKTPYCVEIPFTLAEEEIELLVTMSKTYNSNRSNRVHKFFSNVLGLFYSENGGRITSSDWTNTHKNALEDMYTTVLDRVNSLNLGQGALYPITPGYFGRIYCLKYAGTRSWFGWHYDGTTPNEYRAIFVISQSTQGAPVLSFVDENGQKITPQMHPGRGVLMQGSETWHGVGPSGDLKAGESKGGRRTFDKKKQNQLGEKEEESHRWVLVFTYTKLENDCRDYVGMSDVAHRKRRRR
mmetsp:Transcript_19483/g.29481  ORF Transcript_19483/g.29481 Transcript_19483/m.29481 type:complete len:259 (-) Transcript_19483:244-1020(-)